MVALAGDWSFSPMGALPNSRWGAIVITSVLILCSTLMALWGATMMLWLFSDKPLVQVTVQIVNSQEPTRLILNQRAKHVFT